MREGTFDDQLARGALRTACAILSYEAAHLAEFRTGERIIRAVHGPPEALGFAVGDRRALQDTWCQRVVDGRIAAIVPDVEPTPSRKP